jgi:hypothetical protein
MELTMTASLDELPPLLTPPELAQLLRTTTNSLAQDRYLGRGVPFVRHGRKVLYARTDVSAYLGGTGPPAPMIREAARPNDRRTRKPARGQRGGSQHTRR